ncbi:MAG: M24 family metallopeptidase [Candidatus Hodarchaeales archaeon]|jgi:Xaa-Pro aminopeptidase
MARYITKEKLNLLFDSLEPKDLDFLYISDSEAHRNVNLKFITGHPEDASLFIDIKNRQTLLIPWDYQLAQTRSEADRIINATDYGGVVAATIDIFNEVSSSSPKVGITRSMPYANVQNLKDKIEDIEIIYDPNSIDNLLDKLRSTKTAVEVDQMRKSVEISNQIVEEMKETLVEKNRIKTEMDLAVFVESRMRKLGAHGIGFESLVASSARSWQIHTYPRADPNLSFYRPGLALIDFGVQAIDLTSDVTVPFIMGSMNEKMKTIVETVQTAHGVAMDKLTEAEFLHEVAEAADQIIEKQNFKMPHALGHGIGLTVHDSPLLRKKPAHESLLKNWEPTRIEEGMIITIEPGIYEKDVGGFRLENDVLITRNGPEILTNSEPVYITL